MQGRKSRFRTADDVEELVRLNWAQGISKFFITDDNFARNKEWESIFDRLIELREQEGIPLGLMIQVDTLCHKISGFIEKAKRAGITRVFIGLENINPDNLVAAKKRQNKITEYRSMLLAWKAQGIMTLAGYILGFPADTPETIRRDIGIIQRELPLDIIEFFCLTPLPGSEDHQRLWKAGVPMEPDLNRYDLEHVCAPHPQMSRAEWEAIYLEAWSLYYTPAHMATLLRRAVATGLPLVSLIKLLLTFATTVRLEKVHPLQSGLLRLKHPSERRPGLRPRAGAGFLAGLCVADARHACGDRRHHRPPRRRLDAHRARRTRPGLRRPRADPGGRRRGDGPLQQHDRRANRRRPPAEGRSDSRPFRRRVARALRVNRRGRRCSAIAGSRARPGNPGPSPGWPAARRWPGRTWRRAPSRPRPRPGSSPASGR